MWKPHGFHGLPGFWLKISLEMTISLCFHVISTQKPHGFNGFPGLWLEISLEMMTFVVSSSFSCFPILSLSFCDWFPVSSTLFPCWKMTNLWKSVTSLRMVQLWLCLDCWKALDLFYHLVTVWCHLYVGKLQYIWKWWHHFPFSQISLQSHVTTLSQPIRSLNLLKSPRTCENLWDFTHLKIKAVEQLC